MMTIAWFMQERMKNAAIVDVAWSKGFTMCALLYALLGQGAPVRKIVIVAMVMCWSMRLAIHCWTRILREKEEDKRYAEMRQKWKDSASWKFFLMFQFQGLTVVGLSVPFLLACRDPLSYLRVNEYIAIGLFALSLLGEVIADRQLDHFKANAANKGEVCNVGLWKYSRHPNYFFEWMIWCSFALFVILSPHGNWALLSPMAMLLFLTTLSGIPLAEKQSLLSKGEKYKVYQHETSPFIPWFRRRV